MCDHFTRCTDHYIGTHTQGFFLLNKSTTIATTIYRNRAYTGEIRQALHMLCNLYGQFPGGHNDQCGDAVLIKRSGENIINERQ